MTKAILRTAVVTALVAGLVIPATGASVAAPSSKRISVSEGSKIYQKALKATNAWLKATPHTTTIRTEDSTNPNRPVSTGTATIDMNGNMLFVDSGEETYFIGETLYTNNDVDGLADYELAIAQDLGLDYTAAYVVMNPKLLDPDYPINEWREVYREVQDGGFTGFREGLKTKSVTYSKSGSTEILTVTLLSPATVGMPSVKNVLVNKIERGRITASSATYISAGDRYKTTTTYKSYTGTINPPPGPYFEWDKVFKDPRYGKMTDEKIADNTLMALVREARALAAFDSIENPTIEIWTRMATDYDTMVVYDRGVEFTYYPGEAKRACGVFTADGAELSLQSCEELGFTKR